MASNSILKKGKDGYGYRYTEIAQINEYLASIGISYKQYIEREDGEEYIYTIAIDEDGTKSEPMRGCRILTGVMVDKYGKPTANIMQDYGASVTYARRYSLMLAFGLATTDTDGLTKDEIEAKEQEKKAKESKKPAKNTNTQERRKNVSQAKTEAPKDKPNKVTEVFVMTQERIDMVDELLFYAEQVGKSTEDVLKLCKAESFNEISNARLEKGIELYKAKYEEIIAKERAEKSAKTVIE